MDKPNPSLNKNTPRQKYLGDRGMLIFLVFLSAFAPLSTDLYLTALPTMTTYFNVPEYLTNLTLILFFIFFSLGILIWGPLSDKYGRRPVLLVGITGYASARSFMRCFRQYLPADLFSCSPGYWWRFGQCCCHCHC